MAVSKEEILTQIQPGEVITAKLLTDITEFVEAQKGPKGDTGAKGNPGAAGADGASVKEIILTTYGDGVVMGGTAILTNNQTVPITVKLHTSVE